MLTTIESNAKRGASLVKQVLSLARGVEGERTIVQIKHLVKEIQHIVVATFPKSIEFYTDLASGACQFCRLNLESQQVVEVSAAVS